MAGDASEDDNVTRVFLAEAGECRLDEVNLAEEDDLELVADEVLGRSGGGELFDCADNRYRKLAQCL